MCKIETPRCRQNIIALLTLEHYGNDLTERKDPVALGDFANAKAAGSKLRGGLLYSQAIPIY